MTWKSRVGKLDTRDQLLSEVSAIRPWLGNEDCLDVGCGRGLMMIGAAKRLSTGKAVGIDLWSAKDQAANSPEATLMNARLEGVEQKISIQTGDARQLPYADDSFDIVMSHWVIHNIEAQADRDKALSEMWRVLRPGGALLTADIEFVPAYAQQLDKLGAKTVNFYDGGREARIMGILSGGSYRPQAVIALKACT